MSWSGCTRSCSGRCLGWTGVAWGQGVGLRGARARQADRSPRQLLSCPPSRQNADTAKQLTVTQQSQEEVARVKEQLAFQMEQARRDSEMKVCELPPCPRVPPIPHPASCILTHCPCCS